MWDCKYRTVDDRCRKRKNVCYPGAHDCVVEGKFVYPLRQELKKHKQAAIARWQRPALNKTWHQSHRMPAKATLAQRIRWHLAHQKHCACRPIPPKLLEKIKPRKASSTA